ncbi:Transcriptional activator protein NhaR [Rahnella aquatilis]|nr:Transcriptional activator protein NhaR [Rahnella aquatilis]
MPHINYNHLYYFWHVCKSGSVVGAAEVLHLTPQTITGQIKSLEERLDGKLFKRQGRGLVPSELGQLVYRYADKMFTLSQEMLDIVKCVIQTTGQPRIGSCRAGQRANSPALF